ncbi:hypothetical protein E0Z10_g377 [Xylaria hypoxylon]|uniref:Aminoglycoside phosphotransferase domain-containing protein n=1 Tax=Xylaria hypoxylon TaxID=37992 RepID=A0A4Z0YX23_9PEZI|nr:hypothetical protein E0Z10_g377 [Xylaria hypoxylon]
MEELYERILEEFDRDSFRGECCFSLGDCHPGAILLPSWGLLAETQSKSNVLFPEPIVAVIDWEFSEISGRGVNGDMAQFVASLHCHWLYLEALLESIGNDSETSDKESGIRKALAVTDAFIRGICMSYAEVLIRTFASDVMGQRLRSTVILFGRETINQAYETAWDLEGYAISRDENRMVVAGAGYLRKAGKDVSEALEIWSDHMEEKGIISMLFGFLR